METKKLQYIDLFAGCGGLSLGLHNSGLWGGIFAVEKYPDAFLTLEHNLIEKKHHFNWPQWLPQTEHDVNHLTDEYFNELKKLKHSIDLVVGGPPCQGFSVAGKREENDERNKLIDSYIKFIRLVQPRILFFENVKGFTQKFKKNKSQGRAYSEYLKAELETDGDDFVGYDVLGKLVNFADYGVPQKRIRYILVGIRKDINNKKYPKLFFETIKEKRSEFLSSKGLNTTTNLKEAVSDLAVDNETINSPDSKNFLSGKYKKTVSNYQAYMREGISADIPDSHRFTNHRPETITLFNTLLENVEKGKRITKEEKAYYGVKKRSIVVFDPDVPAPTLTTHPDDYVHYSEPRILTVREYARVQTFPDSFEFKGQYTTGGKRRVREVPRYSQVGNAIPPLFGELVGLTLWELLENE